MSMERLEESPTKSTATKQNEALIIKATLFAWSGPMNLRPAGTATKQNETLIIKASL